ncbi:S-layer homology domain-containing protein [Lysinibacillus sp. CD3-6]|uniref:S-layer homology domain-containing protein n=1 Tax=Lysinibacillus sp. CD3-6 TaxID=2892541 RepID=UPI00116F849E|nr:S-layer homology domain-containing protein [Lysinibacillus sp. CD3-6]UED78582.1 S-layer homology domain-containing protein [Lysinibacillus sp. CD3-6]
MKKLFQTTIIVAVWGTLISFPIEASAYEEPTHYVHMKTENMTVYSAYGATINATEKNGIYSIKANIVNNRQPLEVVIFKNGQSGVLQQVLKKGMEPVAYRDEGDRVVAIIHNNAELKFVQPEQLYFRDLAKTTTSFYIQTLAERGIIRGRTPDNFGVNDSLTRAQFSALLVRAFSFQQEPTKQFSDINQKTSWYGGHVGALHALGIIHGKTPTIFDPNGKITRQQAILMLGRTLDAVDFVQEDKEDKSILPFEDSHTFQGELLRHIETLYTIGALDDNTNLNPNQYITRGQFAKMLAVTLQATGRL